VFTVPHELNPLALTTPALFYDLLFSTTAQTLLEVAANPPTPRSRDRLALHPSHLGPEPAASSAYPLRHPRRRTRARPHAIKASSPVRPLGF
jgi:hypothetical protein